MRLSAIEFLMCEALTRDGTRFALITHIIFFFSKLNFNTIIVH